MIKNGTGPRKKDHRKYSFHRTFGGMISPVATIPDDFNFDAGFGMPDQEADGLPYGCTGYTSTELCQDEDLIAYDPRFTYDETLAIEGIGASDPTFEKVGCQIQDSLKSTMIYGVKPKAGGDSYTHRRGAYYDAVDNDQGLDAFDAIRSTMWKNYTLNGKKRTVSVGTPWFPEWSSWDASGIVPDGFFYSGDPGAYQWHNWKIAGFATIAGELVAIAKTWQGTRVGDQGWLYFKRATVNAMLAVKGTSADTLAPYVADDVATVRLTIMEQIISYYYKLIGLLTKQAVLPPISPPPVVESKPMNTTAPTQGTLDEMCAAIRDYEGSPGDRNYRNNNPGNCRYSAVGYASMYGTVNRDADGFAIFKDYATGMLYLHNFIKAKAAEFPAFTLVIFFAGVKNLWPGYSPSDDGNDPVNYAAFVAKRMNVGTDFQLKNLS